MEVVVFASSQSISIKVIDAGIYFPPSLDFIKHLLELDFLGGLTFNK